MLKPFVLAATLLLAACTTIPDDNRVSYSREGLANAVRLLPTNPEIDMSCSGVVIKKGLVMTAKHCTGIPEPVVQDSQGVRHKVAKITHRADGHDVSVLVVPTIGCPCATIAGDPVESFERVLTVGWPHGLGAVVHFGVFQSRIVFGDSDGTLEYLFLALHADGGQSGGGVYVLRNGQLFLVGIVSAGPPSGNVMLAVELV